MSNNNTNNNDDETTNTNSDKNSDKNTKTQKPKLYEDACIFGNFFGLVPDSYVKYFNLFALQLSSTLIFAIIYYILLVDFDDNFFIQSGFPKNQFVNHKMWIALIMSINFQTTTAYVDIKCKNFLSRAIITLQIVSTFAITFMFFL
jgi:hypothetical protein